MKDDISIHQELRKYAPLLLLPILFSIALYFFVQSFTVRQLELSADQTLDLFYMQMSSMARETDNVARSISSDFSMLDNLPNTGSMPFSFQDPFSISRQMDIRKGESPYIDRIYFVSSKNDAIYSDGGYYTYSSLSNILTGIGLSTDDFLSIDEPSWNMSTMGHLKEPFYVIPFRNTEGEIIGRLLFVISLDKFVDTISSLDAQFACLYTDDFLISSKTLGLNYSISDLSSEKSVSRLLGEQVKCFYVEKGGYTYLIAISAMTCYTPLIWMVVSFFIYALLVFIIGFLYLLKVSKARYAEITSLINALPQEGSAESPSYRDLVPAVQSALLNAADLRKKQQQMTNDYIFHNVLHHYYKPSMLQKYAQEIGIPTSDATYCLAHFYIRKWDSIALEASSPEDSYQMAWTIFKTAIAQFAENTVQIVCDNDTNAFNALFCGSFPKQPSYVETVCENICKFMRDEYGILLHASVSNPTQDFSEIPNLLTQAQTLESFSLSINSTALVISEALLKEHSRSFIAGDFFRQELTLSNTLLVKKYDAVPALVASILEEHVTGNPDYDLAISRLKAVSGTLAEALGTITGVDLDLNLYAQRLREINSVSELNADVEFIFLQLDSVINAAPSTYKEVDDACAYIKNNLADKNLNVTMISEAVGMIPQRLIPMFQKQLNMGIAEYVNYCRVQEAKKLLTTTKLTVKKIGEDVGYSTTDTFTRNFRKLENLTPTEYRGILS